MFVSKPDDEIFVWPAESRSTASRMDKERKADGVNDSQRGSYLGPMYRNDEIRAYLETQKIPFTELNDSELPDKIANLVNAQKVIGWFYGRMEFGPRALGARSIIGDARSPKMQELMNLKIKFRESFRPFAPSVLREKLSDWFELDQESPYMLLVAPVSKNRRPAETPNNSFGYSRGNSCRLFSTNPNRD